MAIKTSRLVLRMLRESDFDAYAAMCADPEVMRFIGSGKPLQRSEAWRSMAGILGHWQLRGYGLWAVELRDTGELVGRIGFLNPEGWPGFELGWMLRRDYWGQGYAIEGAVAALRYAFTELRQPHVISLIRPENRRSIRLAERLGETPEGQIELFEKEAIVYGISREHWLEAERIEQL